MAGQNLQAKPVVLTDPEWPLADSPRMTMTFRVGLPVLGDFFH